MISEPLKRTNYDHSDDTTAQDHHQDFSQYYEPLARMEHADFFDWGIVQGLNITGTIGGNELQVQPGVALDREGRLISLSVDGLGDVGANPLATPPQSTPAPVPVVLATTGHEDETAFVTIQFSEFFSSSPTDPFDAGDFEQRPWVRLQDVSLFDPIAGGLILARVTIDTAGAITGIHGQERSIIKSSLNSLRLRKGQAVGPASGNFDIAEEPTVELDGNTADVNVGGSGQAGDLRVRNSSGDTTAHLDGATGDLLLGGAGQAGNLQVRNSGGASTAQIDGATGDLTLGGSGQAGNIELRNSSGAPTAQIDGATGDMTLGGAGQDGDLVLRNSSGSPTAQINAASADFTLGGGGQEGDIRVRDGAGREVLHFDGNVAALSIGTNGNEGDLQVRDGAGRRVFNFNGNSAALDLGASGNEGDLTVRNNTGSTTVRIDGQTGTLTTGTLTTPNINFNNPINVNTKWFRIHGYDLVLDGRSGGNKRALVDNNNQLIINYNNDYTNGAYTPGSLTVDGALQTRVDGSRRRLGGNPAIYVRYVYLVARNGARTVTQTVDLGSTRNFFAFTAMVGQDPLADFDRHDGHAAEVYRIDGSPTWKWLHGGDHFGGSGSDANFHRPAYRGRGRRIMFRARTFDNAELYAIGVVFYE